MRRKEDPTTTKGGPFLDCVSLEGKRLPNIECWLVSIVIFRGIRTRMAMEPYSFVVSSGFQISCPPYDPMGSQRNLLLMFIFYHLLKLQQIVQ